MYNFEKFKRDEKARARERADWTCEICQHPAQFGERGHILRRDKSNLNSFTKWFIDCSENFLWVHSRCNAAADRGNTLAGREAHILRVIAYLAKHPGVPPLVVYDPITKKTYFVKTGGK